MFVHDSYPRSLAITVQKLGRGCVLASIYIFEALLKQLFRSI
eukprot:SAG11_NODE_13812_length_638_cov_0.862709_1_plen_41_part_10